MENKSNMFNKSVCRKVSSMLSLYIDNKLSVHDYAFIDEHLSQCDECYKKYLYLKSLIKSLKDSYKQVVELAQKKQKQATFSIREHEKFLDNLSPYVDNELDAQECFEFRKYLIKLDEDKFNKIISKPRLNGRKSFYFSTDKNAS